MRFRDFHPNIQLRMVLNFTDSTLSNMITPFMTIYFAKTLGTTFAGAASVLSILVGLLFSTFGGYYADQIGRKKVLVCAEAMSVAAYGIMAIVNSPLFHSPYITLLMMMVNSASWGLNKPAFDAMLIDVSTTENRKSIYSFTYWSNNLAISVAGIVGAFFFSNYLFQLLLVVAGMSLVALAVTKFYISETLMIAVNKSQKKPSILESYKQVAQDKKFMVYILASILIVSVEMNLTNYIGIRLDHHMQDAAWISWIHAKVDGIHMLGYLRTENTVAVVVLSLLLGRLLKARSNAKTMLAAILMNIIGYSYLVCGNQPILLMLLMLLATIGELTYVPIKQSLLVNLVPDHARSAYMAVNSTVNRASQILSGFNVIIGGFLSPGNMTILIFLTGMSGVLLLASILPSLQKHPVLVRPSKESESV